MLPRRTFLEQSAAGLCAGIGWATWTRMAEAAGLATPAVTAAAEGKRLRLANGVIQADWEVSPSGLAVTGVRLPGGKALPAAAPWPVFGITVAGAALDSTGLGWERRPAIATLAARPGAANYAERLPGREITGVLRDRGGRFRATWRAILRSGSHYIRQEVTIEALGADLPLSEIRLLDLPLPGATVSGTVKGSPVTTSDDWFLAFEHPLCSNGVSGERVLGAMARPLPLRAGQSATGSSVIGAAPAGQMRRAFQQYVERERAHPYRPFLHYNSWFDLGYFTPYDQAGCLDVIHTFGKEMVRQRHVQMDSFLFDDGWDNHRDWGFNAGFPDGFTPLKSACARIGTAPGVWLSPWGGYGKPRQERLAYARAHGYEINKDGLALSGPVYYKLFHRRCLEMVERYGINQFKFDGTGSVAEVVPGSAFGSDFEAAIALIHDLRAAKPDLFINLTTGTYPSPFWLRYADSTWRGGSDTSFAGVGTDRQQWITYRDGDTFRHVVGRGPLYPLNSLMLHGIVYAKHARRLETDPGHDFTAEVRAYFGTGTQLQEMYLSHDLLTSANWDRLAEAARWARRQGETLLDTHWIGGDPAALEAYGHAAWSPRGAILTLRNPSNQPQSLSVDAATAFELPAGARTRYTLHVPWSLDQWGKPVERPPLTLEAGTSASIELQPFEVLTLQSRG